MPTLESIIKEKSKRLQLVPDRLLSQVEKTQKKLFTEILSLMDDLTVKDGFIELSTGNLATVDKIVSDLRTALNGSDYFDAVKEFGKEFNVQAEINASYFKEAFTDFKSPEIAEALVSQAKVATVDALIGAPLDVNWLKPLEKTLTDLVSSGASWKESVKTIRTFAEGDEDVDGKLLQYSKQIAHDAFAYSDRSYSNAVADELEGEWFYYFGDEILTTRCFCGERHGKYYHYKEIEAWGRGENIGECRSGDLWQGANRQTNEQTIFIFVGGHNCMHSLILTSIFDVPKADIQRNIDNGNYVPTEFEVAEIGL